MTRRGVGRALSWFRGRLQADVAGLAAEGVAVRSLRSSFVAVAVVREDLREARAGEPQGRDLEDGFALTGFFLSRHVLEPRGQVFADERMHFIAALTRALPHVA